MKPLALTSVVRSKRATSIGSALDKSATVVIPPASKRDREVGPIPLTASTGCVLAVVVTALTLDIVGDTVVARKTGLAVVMIGALVALMTGLIVVAIIGVNPVIGGLIIGGVKGVMIVTTVNGSVLELAP